MRFREQREKGRLCAEAAAAGAAVTAAVLSRAPRTVVKMRFTDVATQRAGLLAAPKQCVSVKERARPRGRFRRGAAPYEPGRRERERARER